MATAPGRRPGRARSAERGELAARRVSAACAECPGQAVNPRGPLGSPRPGPCRGCGADQGERGHSQSHSRAHAPTLLHSRAEPRAAPSAQWGARPQVAESREEVSHAQGRGMAQRRTRVSGSGAQSVGQILARSE